MPYPPYSHSHSAISCIKPIGTSADWTFFLGTVDRVANTDESGHRVGTAFGPMPWVVAFDGQDSFQYARDAFAVSAAASVAAESAGGEDGGESDSSCALFNSPLTTPLPKPTIANSPTRRNPTAQCACCGSPCRYIFKSPTARFRYSTADFILPCSVPCGTAEGQHSASNRPPAFHQSIAGRGHARVQHYSSELRGPPQIGRLAAAS
jgi:hypothetical protein